MAANSYSCSVRQGFNFEKDAQVLVGHINSLSIAGSALKADISATDPTSANMATTVKVMGIVSQIYWAGGYADPIQFSCQVSTDNKNTLATLQHSSLSNTEIEVKFTIYDYDPSAKKFFKCFFSDDAGSKGLIEKSGGTLALSIDMDQSMEVTNPKNYTFSLGVMPKEVDQSIHMAVSDSAKFVKHWGVAVG